MDPYFLQHNERCKTAAAALSGAGVALLGYSLGKMSDGHQDLVTSISIVVSVVLFCFAYVVLGELVEE